MENLPQLAISITLSFSQVEDVVRCACVARAWASCVQTEPIASKVLNEKPMAIAKRVGDEVAVNLLSVGLEAKYHDDDDFDYMGFTPLHFGSFHGNLPFVQALLAQGADVNTVSDYDDTPLHIAARQGHYSIVEVLLSHGATVDSRDEIDRTPLMLAAIFGHQDVAMTLIAQGAEVNAADDGSNTALILAATEGQLPLVQALISSGADSSLENDAGKTALQKARENGHTEIALILEQASDTAMTS